MPSFAVDLLDKPQMLREFLNDKDDDIINRTINYSEITIADDKLKLKSGESFPFLPDLKKKVDRLIGINANVAKTITDDHRNYYFEKYKNRKLKLYTHEPSGDLVSICGIDENPYTNNRILNWLALYVHSNPELKLNLVDFDHRKLEIEIVNDKYTFEAAPMDLLKTSLYVKTNSLSGKLNIMASLYRQVCENGSIMSEMNRHTHVGVGADAGAYRMNLNKELNMQLKKISSINEGIGKLLSDVPDNILEHADTWLLRQRQNKEVRKAVINDLEASRASTKYDVFNSITHARHELKADPEKVQKLGILAGKYFSDQTSLLEITI